MLGNVAMKKFVIGKICKAREFVMIEAENEADALRAVELGSGRVLNGNLEFYSYMDKNTWTVEDISQFESSRPHFRVDATASPMARKKLANSRNPFWGDKYDEYDPKN